jgi:hypothetical protein
MMSGHRPSFFYSVIPAQAGIHTRVTDVRTLRLDSRLRGNDVWGGGAPQGAFYVR